MRILIIDANPQAQIQGLFSANLSTDAAAAARASLQKLNPHVNLSGAVKKGTVLVVPDTSSFNPSASSSSAAGPLDDLQNLVQKAFHSTTQRLQQGTDARKAERANVASALKTVSANLVGASDADLQHTLDETTKALAQEELDDAQAGQDLARTTKAALGTLSELAKLLH